MILCLIHGIESSALLRKCFWMKISSRGGMQGNGCTIGAVFGVKQPKILNKDASKAPMASLPRDWKRRVLNWIAILLLPAAVIGVANVLWKAPTPAVASFKCDCDVHLGGTIFGFFAR